MLSILALLVALPALAAEPSAVITTDHVRAELVAHAPHGVVPGKPSWLGLSIRHEPHWHTYWKNPGDSGLPITLRWTLPGGVQAGDIEWPTPKQLAVGPLMNYGYEDALLLPVPMTVTPAFAADELAVTLHAEWLVCNEICLPESGEFALRVPARTPTVAHAAAFDATRALIPKTLHDVAATGRVDGRVLAIAVDGLPSGMRGEPLDVFVDTGGVIDHAAPVDQRWTDAAWSARMPLSLQRSESPSAMQAVLVDRKHGTSVNVRFDIAGSWTAPGAAASMVAAMPTAAPARVPASLTVTLGLALLGGMLLNLMPCVFPILSLKVFGFAQPGHDRRMLAMSGVAYSIGVVVSFVALAALLLALRAGGELLGWGFQLQSPGFVVLLAALFTLIGLNFAGVFEFGNVVPSRIAAMSAKHPLVDHALTGVLAVAVASPCTGPFMGAALGAALALPSAQALLVFAVLGLGMALPYLAISFAPALARRMPRPGAWMQHFKVAMAFPMFATVVWLLWVLGHQIGVDGSTAVLAMLVAIAFLAWTLGAASLRRRSRSILVTLAALLLVALVRIAWPMIDAAPTSTTTADTRWRAWSPEAVAGATADGRRVFVDFTAAWCVTCQFNKRTALADADVLAKFARADVLLLRADWTRRDPRITAELARLGRSGVPVYAFYGPGTRPPQLLSEILTVDQLMRAIDGP